MAVIPALARGGAERVFCLLTKEWAKRFDVVGVLLDGSRRAYECGGRVVDCELNVATGRVRKLQVAVRSVMRLVRLIREERPSEIISFMEPASIPTAVAAALCGGLGRVTVSVRNNPGSLPLGRRVIMRLCYRFVRRVVAPSRGVEQHLTRMGIPAAKILTIPNPVVTRRAEESGLHSPLPCRFVLGVGRLHPQKGFDRLLAAFARLGRPELHLVILGEGSERGALLTLAKELAIADRVHLPGVVTDVDRWYRNAACFVLSSRYEGWPNVIMEAMANRCAVVGFCCAYGPSEMIENGRNGLLVPEGDVRGLSRAVASVVDDEALRQHLAKGGEGLVESLRPDTVAARWVETV